MSELREAIAKAIYETDPHYEGGEYVDSFQVSPGGNLPWEMAVSRDAEFAGDKLMLPITKWAYDAADAAIAAWNRRSVPAVSEGCVSVPVAGLLALRDALLERTSDGANEAWHQLYAMADPAFTSFTPWAEWEALSAAMGEPK